WGNEAVVERLSMLTDRLADGLANTGVQVIDKQLRAPHVLSLAFPKGMTPDLPKKLAAENVYAAPRLGARASVRTSIMTKRTSSASSRCSARLQHCSLRQSVVA